MRQFLSIQEAAEELGMSTAHIRNLIRGIQRNTPERYYVSDVFNGGKVAVRFVALQDYARYQNQIHTAPPYRPIERERELGISEGVSGSLLDADTIAAAVVKMLAQRIGGATV